MLPNLLAMTVVVAFSSCLDIAAIEMEMGQPLDCNGELQTVRFVRFFSFFFLNRTLKFPALCWAIRGHNGLYPAPPPLGLALNFYGNLASAQHLYTSPTFVELHVLTHSLALCRRRKTPPKCLFTQV